jgi:hypothetical protein
MCAEALFASRPKCVRAYEPIWKVPATCRLRQAPGFRELSQKAEQRQLEIHAAFLEAGGEQLLSAA